MPKAKHDVLQGTLTLLILKTLSTGPLHGYAITHHIQTVSEEILRVEEGSLYPALHRMEQDGSPDRLIVIEESKNGESSGSNPARLADWAREVADLEAAASRACFSRGRPSGSGRLRSARLWAPAAAGIPLVSAASCVSAPARTAHARL